MTAEIYQIASWPEYKHEEILGPKMRRPTCKDTTNRDAVSDMREDNDQSSPQSSLEEEKAGPRSTNTPDRLSPATLIRTCLSSTQVSSLYFRTLILLLVFVFWRYLSISVSIRTASSSNHLNHASGVPQSELRCNSWLCYSASLSLRKSEGLMPEISPKTTNWISPVLKRCGGTDVALIWNGMPNGRSYEVRCSDESIKASTDFRVDGGRAAASCLLKCIVDNDGCEGVLHLVDRPFESNCFFQHNSARPVFEAGERVVGVKLLRD